MIPFLVGNVLIQGLFMHCVSEFFILLLGMNPAIRAVVRMGLYAGAKVYAVWEVCFKKLLCCILTV